MMKTAETSAQPRIKQPLGLEMVLMTAGIQPTKQRLAVANVLLQSPIHLTAEEVLLGARQYLSHISRATVYNTLQAFLDKGLIRSLHLDAERTVYDSRPESHPHLYHEDTGVLEDLPLGLASLVETLDLPPHLELLGLDLVVRVQQRPMQLHPINKLKI